MNYYNEFDPYAAQWLRNLISAGLIAPGDVDDRSIVDVRPDDLAAYTQCHFFAGIGGWQLALRLAGWPDDRPVWTGSCPCQPFSVAGKQEGQADERHLWPTFFELIRARRPDVVMGEQVAAAVGKHWLDGVHSDLEGIGYACGATVVPACAVDAPHRRERLWFVANTSSERRERGQGRADRDERNRAAAGWAESDSGAVGCKQDAYASALADPECAGPFPGALPGVHRGEEDAGSRHVEPIGHSADGHDDVGNAIVTRLEGQPWNGNERHQPGRIDAVATGPVATASSLRRNSTAWSGAEWLSGADGKARRIEPSIRLLAHGVPARVGKLRAYGNAIVPQVAAEVIGAYLESHGEAA